MLAYIRLVARETGEDWKRAARGAGFRGSGNNLVDQETGLTRSGVGDLDALFRSERVAVVGAGGTGGYIVDLVANCNVERIDIYDADVVSQHTQLRWPGIVPRSAVESGANKAEYLAKTYASRTNRNIRGHPIRIDKVSATRLNGCTVVFVAIDNGPSRREVLTALAGFRICFIDCGVDLHRASGTGGGPLAASVRVVRSLPSDSSDTLAELIRKTPDRDVGEGLYESAIQTAEMNALNATLAVAAWKQNIGFYRDLARARRLRLHLASTRWVAYDGNPVSLGDGDD